MIRPTPKWAFEGCNEATLFTAFCMMWIALDKYEKDCPNHSGIAQNVMDKVERLVE